MLTAVTLSYLISSQKIYFKINIESNALKVKIFDMDASGNQQANKKAISRPEEAPTAAETAEQVSEGPGSGFRPS